MKILVCLLLVAGSVRGQDCPKVWLSGRVKDSSEFQNFYNLMVFNRSSGRGVFGNPDGTFGVYTGPNDSITLSVKGYYMVGFRVKPDSNCRAVVEASIVIKAHDLDEVVVKPLKTLQQVKEERLALAMRETRTVTGINVLQSPITALYQRFSKVEQSKRKVAELEYKDSEEQILQELLQLYVAYDVIKLTPEQFDEFIRFLNVDESFLKTANDMELITYIKDKFEHYQRIQQPAE